MKKNYSQEILIMVILLFTLALLWVYISVRKTLVKSEKPILTPQEIKVLDPKLDEELLNQLRDKVI